MGSSGSTGTLTGATFEAESGKEGTNMDDDLYDIPVVYLLYVLLAIVLLVAGAAVAIIML